MKPGRRRKRKRCKKCGGLLSIYNNTGECWNHDKHAAYFGGSTYERNPNEEQRLLIPAKSERSKFI